MEANNMAAMREALLIVKRLFDSRIMFQPAIRKAHKAVDAALAAPPRNCDVGTAEEQEARFERHCASNNDPEDGDGECFGCPLLDNQSSCEFAWAQMPYEAEEGGEA